MVVAQVLLSIQKSCSGGGIPFEFLLVLHIKNSYTVYHLTSLSTIQFYLDYIWPYILLLFGYFYR